MGKITLLKTYIIGMFQGIASLCFALTELASRLPGSVILRLSGPIKEHWARELNLNFEELLSDTTYKEQYRAQMIAWSEDVRSKDPSFFCRAAIEMYKGNNICWRNKMGL